MTHASLCTGIGACELAAIWMGWDNVFSCEINQFCQRVLKYHYPNSKHYGNIYEQDFSEWRDKIDILTAGFPCQPFSVAGSRKGTEDDRYLWPEVLRAINEIRPAWFIGENVAGITSMVLPGDEIEVGSYQDVFGESYQETEMRQQFVIDRICDDLEHIGYSVQPVIIPACAVGAPHRRDRVWFIANANKFNGNSSESEKESIAGRFGESCTGNNEWIYNSQGTVANSISIRGTSSRKNSETEKCWRKDNGQPQEWREQAQRPDGPYYVLRHFTNPQCIGSNKIYKKIQSKFTNGMQPFGNGCEQYVANTAKSPTTWEKFPSQSPICSGDDGISDRLSDITVSRWITEATRAFGNSMVPQVVLEIFKAIEEVEK